MVEVDLLGQAYGAMAALLHIKRRRAAIVHVTSVLGSSTRMDASEYAYSRSS